MRKTESRILDKLSRRHLRYKLGAQKRDLGYMETFGSQSQ